MFLVSDVVSGSASQSSSANDISSMSTEQTLASDTDSSSIDTLTGPLDESQWTQSMATCVCLSACLSSHLQYPNITFLSPLCSLIPPFSEFFCSTFFFYAAFLFFTLQPQWIGLFFYFLFVCDDVETSDFVFGLLLRGQSYLSCLLGQRFIFLFLMDIV